jgi:hypothetical protein
VVGGHTRLEATRGDRRVTNRRVVAATAAMNSDKATRGMQMMGAAETKSEVRSRPATVNLETSHECRQSPTKTRKETQVTDADKPVPPFMSPATRLSRPCMHA